MFKCSKSASLKVKDHIAPINIDELKQCSETENNLTPLYKEANVQSQHELKDVYTSCVNKM